MIKRILLLILSAYPLLYAADDAKPPVIPADIKLEFYRAQAKFLGMQQQLQQASAAYQAMLERLGKVCGEKYQVAADPSGDPVCTVKEQPKTPMPQK